MNTTGFPVDIEALLAQGKIIEIAPRGYSMYPVWVPGRDRIIIGPVGDKKLRRGDVVLFRRENSILVVHRIFKRKGDELYLVGDNQSEIEGPVKLSQVRGLLLEIIRKDKHISVRDALYRALTGIWLFLRPLRPPISKTAAFIKKLFK